MQAVGAMKRVVGEEHPDTLICMSNLAATYFCQERWNEAEALDVQVVDARKRVLGEEHVDTLRSTPLPSFIRDEGGAAEKTTRHSGRRSSG
jgi:hypothetical protein